MPKPEIEFRLPDAPWVRSESSPAGVWEKTLSVDAGTGDMSLLQRYDPGASSHLAVIVHEYWEEVFVVDGDLRDTTLDSTFTAGMYACRPPGMPHGPYTSESGCLMFVTTRSVSPSGNA